MKRILNEDERLAVNFAVSYLRDLEGLYTSGGLSWPTLETPFGILFFKFSNTAQTQRMHVMIEDRSEAVLGISFERKIEIVNFLIQHEGGL